MFSETLSIRNFPHQMDKKSSRTLMLILTTFTYLLLGAAVFDWLESAEDRRLRDEISHIKGNLQKKYNFTGRDMELFEIIIHKSIRHRAGYQWQFSGALYFAVVVITTVGYGNSAPETAAGKIFCMFFALAGIPMGLIMFQSIGERVNTGIAFCLHKVRRAAHQRGWQVLSDVTPTHLLMVSLSIGTTIIIIGTYVFSKIERWSFFEAYYYCFITLSTIGFGDYVPLQQGSALQARPGYVVFNLLFVIVGLAVFSACVNLLVLGFMAPNADEVTAAQREPSAGIILEKFARSGSLVDSQLFGVRRPSVAPQGKRNTRQLSLSSASNIMHFEKPKENIRWFTRFFNLFREPERPSFSIVRPPTRNISHLLSY
ncbi:unnamed protein product [Auanema sp. JU1783]|nr:unnamed protein product [Auanema sp. JU1783]